jgi:hypothetical protein
MHLGFQNSVSSTYIQPASNPMRFGVDKANRQQFQTIQALTEQHTAISPEQLDPTLAYYEKVPASPSWTIGSVITDLIEVAVGFFQMMAKKETDPTPYLSELKDFENPQKARQYYDKHSFQAEAQNQKPVEQNSPERHYYLTQPDQVLFLAKKRFESKA